MLTVDLPVPATGMGWMESGKDGAKTSLNIARGGGGPDGAPTNRTWTVASGPRRLTTGLRLGPPVVVPCSPLGGVSRRTRRVAAGHVVVYIRAHPAWNGVHGGAWEGGSRPGHVRRDPASFCSVPATLGSTSARSGSRLQR